MHIRVNRNTWFYFHFLSKWCLYCTSYSATCFFAHVEALLHSFPVVTQCSPVWIFYSLSDHFAYWELFRLFFVTCHFRQCCGDTLCACLYLHTSEHYFSKGAIEKWYFWFERNIHSNFYFWYYAAGFHQALSIYTSSKMKRCQALLIIRKMKIKITMGHHFYHFRFTSWKRQYKV